MVNRRNAVVQRQLRTLFNLGTIGELTDGQLLERLSAMVVMSARGAALAEEVLKIMFLTKLKTTAAVLLVAGALVTATAGVLAQQGAGPSAAPRGEPRQSVVPEAAQAVTRIDTGGAPAQIKQSRKTMIARLEVDRETAKYRLDLLTKQVESPDDLALVQARTKLHLLDALLARIDTVLVEAAKSYPATVDFSAAPEALVLGAEARDEWAKALSQWTRYEAFKQTRLADMARAKAIPTEDGLTGAKERAAWADEMFKKGYLAKSQLDEARKEYQDLKARQGFERPASPTPKR